MKDIIIALIAGLTVVGLASVIAWSVNNTSRLHNEKVISCVENGGTWVNYGDLCVKSVDTH